MIAGVDEVGRGPLAGPVLAAAVILNPDRPIKGLADSKTLTAARREILYTEIQDKAFAWAIGRAEVEEIDSINILQASLLAMKRAIEALSIMPRHVLIDGNFCPKDLPCSSEAIIQGDQRVEAISAASIIAKVIRDREMDVMDALYPGYSFDTNKGYPTKEHREAIRTYGITKYHRTTFRLLPEQLTLDL